MLVSPEKIEGVVSHDAEAGEVTVRGGTGLHDLGRELHEVGLALQNYGDVDYQAIGGVVGTGTHGTGRELGSFSSMVLSTRIATP